MIPVLGQLVTELWPVARTALPWVVARVRDIVEERGDFESTAPMPWKDVEHVRSQVEQATDPARWIPHADTTHPRPGDTH